MTAHERPYRPAPDAAMLVGAVAALAGYLLPWFKVGPSYLWWYSGWEYATLSTGGGWTLLTIPFLAGAVVASLWAGRSVAAAMTAVTAGVAGMFLALAVVAVSLGAMPERSSSNWVGELPFGPGLPLMALGFGLLFAAVLRGRPLPPPDPPPERPATPPGG
ncbi:hypothetical protein AB0M79_29510 [Polymorphospora sp. NPDC051019]|uniref:hypothetical protein n=1 Tax=Polymorphospora sp. NPDC051019 TaxID=3155725 RepID=UPI0034287EBC